MTQTSGRRASTFRTLLIAVLGVCALSAAAPAGASATVCSNTVPNRSFSRTITVGGAPVARVWMHWRGSASRYTESCTVVRAIRWAGTPHYMYAQVCARQTGPRTATGCSGFDAGRYRYYAGPIYSPRIWCQAIRVKIDSPTGHRVFDGFVNGPCD